MERATPLVLCALALACAAISALSYADRSADLPAEAREGKRVYERRNCAACHSVYGLGGILGPDLTNAWSRRGPQHIARTLTEGWQAMPDPKLDEREVEALMDYLELLDTTGEFPPRG